MWHIHPQKRIAACLAGASLVACAGTQRPGASPSAPASTRASGTAAPAPRARESVRPAHPADVHFMSGMIGHHAQALMMAGWAPTHGASAAVRTLAERIVNEQQDEILTMQLWLRDRGQPVPAARPGPMLMTMNGMEHEMVMPGMLTDPQMRQLDAARGVEFDRVFLTYMIQHHSGAVEMVKTLFDTNGAAQDQTTFKLASDVQVDQATEIARMRKMLAALPPS